MSQLSVLQHTITLVERARALKPHDCAINTEYANQLLMSGDVKGAMAAYKATMAIDQTWEDALIGTIHCQILDGQLDDAERALDFFVSVQEDGEKKPLVCYLQGMVASQKHGDETKAVAFFTEAAELHLKALSETEPSMNYFVLMDPDFLLTVAKALLRHSGEGIDMNENGPAGGKFVGNSQKKIRHQRCAAR